MERSLRFFLYQVNHKIASNALLSVPFRLILEQNNDHNDS